VLGIVQISAFLQERRQKSNKPIVVTVFRETAGKPGDYHWYVRNIGRGVAVRVSWIDLESSPPQLRRTLALGALGPGDERPLGEESEETLNGKHDVAGDLMAAEGLHTRTVTANHVGRDGRREILSALVPLERPGRRRLIESLVTEEWKTVLEPALRCARP